METTDVSKFSHRKRTIDSYHRSVARVIAHLTANLPENHTLEDMANVAMQSPFHFNRIFREIVGVSPVRFLYALRIEEAKRLILTTQLKIIDICYSVGYNSLGSFNKRFVSLVGYSPRRIRSIAASVDPADLRRRIATRHQSSPGDPRSRCSIWGTVHAPGDFSGIVMAALSAAGGANDQHIATILPQWGGYSFPPVTLDANHALTAVGLVWHERMADFLLQPNGLLATLPAIHLTTGGRSSPVDLQLAARRPVDPPMPPSLPFKLIHEVMQLPDEVPDDDAAELEGLDAWTAVPARSPLRRASTAA